MSQLKLIPALLMAVASSTTLSVGVISDSHFNTAYNAALASNKCTGAGTSADPYAPLGRYGCDPSEDLIDLMFTRFKEAFGTVDLIIVPGDSVAHKVAATAEGDDPTGSAYNAVKANLAATFGKFKQHFPNTMILPTFGNNDGRYHDEAIDEVNKSDYYNFVYDLWFNQLPGNASLDLKTIKTTLTTAGYYRADVTPTLTLLSLNSMYFDYDDNSTHGGEQTILQNWFTYELSTAKAQGRKVIITDHVYAGSRFQAEPLWKDNYNSWYFSTLRDYSDSVVIEVVGHDHFADLRYHSSQNVADLPDTKTKYDFHNLLVAPGVTPYDSSNPGVAHFEITSTGIPQNLKLEFLNLNDTYGKTKINYTDAKWFSVDFAKRYSVTTITPDSLASFRKILEADESYTLDYLVAKLGFDPSDSKQQQQGIDVLTGIDLVTSKAHHTGEYICQMHKSITAAEYDECASSVNPPALFLQ